MSRCGVIAFAFFLISLITSSWPLPQKTAIKELELILLIDTNATAGEFDRLENFLATLMGELLEDLENVRVAVVSGQVESALNFTADRRELQSSIKSLMADQSIEDRFSLADALRKIYQNALAEDKSPDVARVLIVVGDHCQIRREMVRHRSKLWTYAVDVVPEPTKCENGSGNFENFTVGNGNTLGNAISKQLLCDKAEKWCHFAKNTGDECEGKVYPKRCKKSVDCSLAECQEHCVSKWRRNDSQCESACDGRKKHGECVYCRRCEQHTLSPILAHAPIGPDEAMGKSQGDVSLDSSEFGGLIALGIGIGIVLLGLLALGLYVLAERTKSRTSSKSRQASEDTETTDPDGEAVSKNPPISSSPGQNYLRVDAMSLGKADLSGAVVPTILSKPRPKSTSTESEIQNGVLVANTYQVVGKKPPTTRVKKRKTSKARRRK